MGALDETVDEARMVEHDLVFKADELFGVVCTKYIAKQGEPERLRLSLLVAFAGPKIGKPLGRLALFTSVHFLRSSLRYL